MAAVACVKSFLRSVQFTSEMFSLLSYWFVYISTVASSKTTQFN